MYNPWPLDKTTSPTGAPAALSPDDPAPPDDPLVLENPLVLDDPLVPEDPLLPDTPESPDEADDPLDPGALVVPGAAMTAMPAPPLTLGKFDADVDVDEVTKPALLPGLPLTRIVCGSTVTVTTSVIVVVTAGTGLPSVAVGKRIVMISEVNVW